MSLQEIPDPQPGPMEVRVRIHAVGLNHLDVWTRRGVPGHKFPLPITPGCDIAGEIESFGPGSEALLSRDGLAIGSSVLVNPNISCGRCEACQSGFDPLCPHYGIIGETRDGGCAELAVVPAVNLVPLPAGISMAEAAALPIAAMTAWSMLTRKAEMKAGDTVLIQAGGSGVSIYAIQMAKLLGGTVITTVGSDEKIAKAKELGANHVIQYRKAQFRDEVRKIVSAQGKRGCEIVLDHVGSETFGDSMKCLAWGGKLVTCGATSGSKVEIDLKPLFFKNLSILGSTMGSKADLLRVVRLVGKGKIKPVVDSEFAMKDAPLAFAKLENRAVFGKIVLR